MRGEGGGEGGDLHKRFKKIEQLENPNGYTVVYSNPILSPILPSIPYHTQNKLLKNNMGKP